MHDELMSSMDISQKMLELTACAILPIDSSDTKHMNGIQTVDNDSNDSAISHDMKDSDLLNDNSSNDIQYKNDESIESLVTDVSNDRQNHICGHLKTNKIFAQKIESEEEINSLESSDVKNGVECDDTDGTGSEEVLPNGLKLIDGCVEPPFDPPTDQCLRYTNQLHFLKNMITKYLCRYKTALPFLKPVDCIKLKITDYYKVITNPIDLQTIKKRLMFLWYSSAEECLQDFQLMFTNCYKFNSCDNYVYKAGKKLEEYLNEKLKDMPEVELEMTCPPKPSIADLEKRAAKRRPEISTQELQDSVIAQTIGKGLNGGLKCAKKMITRSEHGFQPKRPNKELPTPIASPSQTQPKRVPLNTSMKFCLDIIKELLTKKHRDYAWPFYEPVSTQVYPDYLQVVKKPIDLTTIKIKIETGQYKTVKPFVKDMRLMITNCLRYNKPEAPVIEQARKVRDLFEYRYARIPEDLLREKMTITHTNGQNNTNSEQHSNGGKHKDIEPVVDSESQQRMKLLETQVKLLTSTISALTGIDTKPLKPKNGFKKNSNNCNNKKRNKPSAKPKSNRSVGKTGRKKNESIEEFDDEEDEELTPSPIPFQFDDMEDLQQLKTDLENLDAKDLKNVLRILQSTEPSIKCDNDENIEIDFEALKPETLIALRKFVSSCMLNSIPKKNKSSVNGSESSKKRSNCDIKNGNSFANDSTSRLSDSSSDSESDSSSASDNEDED